ncbi:MAG: hypothetical protein ACRCX8_19580 [Sarcina sp.]
MVATTRNLRNFKLQKLVESKSLKTGAVQSDWTDLLDSFQISINKTKSITTVDKVRKLTENFIGLTKCTLLEADTTRIISLDNTECYMVKDVRCGLWWNITLEKVEVW